MGVSLPSSALLEGPRGRHLCLSAAAGLHEPVWGAWLHAAWHPNDAGSRAALVTALSATDCGPLCIWSEVESFTGAVGDSVDRAMYWQPPDDQDVVAAMPDVVGALRPIAAAIGSAPGAQWWSNSADMSCQRYVSPHEPHEAYDEPDLGPAAVKLAAWRQRTIDDDDDARRNRPADPAAPYTGHWWSIPTGHGLARTTRALPASGAVSMLWEEDGFGQGRAAVWAMQPFGEPRTYEIDGPDAWIDLVRPYPLDVSWARRHDWFKVTGRVGIWLIPDWEAVSRDYDAVHLTVLGYLASAHKIPSCRPRRSHDARRLRPRRDLLAHRHPRGRRHGTRALEEDRGIRHLRRRMGTHRAALTHRSQRQRAFPSGDVPDSWLLDRLAMPNCATRPSIRRVETPRR